MHDKAILVIGAGKLGTSLYRALHETGHRQVHLLGNRPFSALNTSNLNEKNYYPEHNNLLTCDHEIFFICVRDTQIPGVASLLSNGPVEGSVIYHTSGFRDAQLLEKPAAAGAYTGSFHPVQSFPNPFSPVSIWSRIFCTYEGDIRGKPFVEHFCRAVQAGLIPITSRQKRLMHLSAAILSNYGVALIQWAEALLREAGFEKGQSREIALPLLRRLVSNYEEQDIHKLLTGPLQRGDLEVLQEHLGLLSGTQQALYLNFARLLVGNDTFGIEQREKIRDFIDDYKE